MTNLNKDGRPIARQQPEFRQRMNALIEVDQEVKDAWNHLRDIGFWVHASVSNCRRTDLAAVEKANENFINAVRLREERIADLMELGALDILLSRFEEPPLYFK